MKVLVACEYSGTVRDAFINAGFQAVSCDFLPSEKPGPHYQGDVRDIIGRKWDLMIAHPDCTYLTCSAEWAYGDGPYHMKLKEGTLVGQKRRDARKKSLEFVEFLLKQPIPHKCIENPMGAISRIRPASQYIQPYEFGHDASKNTGLWLDNLPLLIKTRYVEPRIVRGKKRWANQTDSGQNRLPPGSDRWKHRARTYQGIADAMAYQWGQYLKP